MTVLVYWWKSEPEPRRQPWLWHCWGFSGRENQRRFCPGLENQYRWSIFILFFHLIISYQKCRALVQFSLLSTMESPFVKKKDCKEGDMLLSLYRGHSHLSTPLWLTTRHVWSTHLCFSVCVCVCVCVCEKEWFWNTWTCSCIFLMIVLENYSWNYSKGRKSTYFNADEESLHRSAPSWRPLATCWCQTVLCFNRFSLWRVNTES